MLTFILLVILAGGVGLVAASVAERPDPATPRPANRRAGRTGRRTDDAAGAVPRRTATDRSTSRPSRRSSRNSVPASLIAVEGSFAAVAVASPLRRAVSGLVLVTIVVGVAVAIAAGIGLVAVTIGHMLDTAIG